MQFVIFDLDGTLIDATHAQADDRCFWRATRETLLLPDDHPERVEGLRHVTAHCIASQACEQYHGREITVAELDSIAARFTDLLGVEFKSIGGSSLQTRGALELISALRGPSGTGWAVATGCFARSATFKLHQAGLSDPSALVASSNDADSREDIMMIAAQRVAEKHGTVCARPTYVGDGVWDLIAARNLGWNFVGVGVGARAEELRNAGASVVLPDFESTSDCLKLLIS
jgi:phosphoglycolate phosphatase-like HAD superfamily hydrolase